MKLSEENAELRAMHIQYVNTRWKQLYEMVAGTSKDATTYLMITNSGGAIGVLSFMGAMKDINPIPGALYMLASFAVGVVLIGFGRAVNYYRANWLFSGWESGVTKYYADTIEWGQLVNDDNTRSKYFILADIIAWLSFFCFLTGLAIGFASTL